MRDSVLAKAGFVAYYGVPLVAKGELRGVLEVLYRRRKRCDEELLGFLQTVAWQAATAVDGAILVDELVFFIYLALDGDGIGGQYEAGRKQQGDDGQQTDKGFAFHGEPPFFMG